MHTRSLLVAGAVAIAVLGCQDEPTAPQTELAPHTASAARPIEGWFHVLWVDPAPGYGPATVQYELVDGQGHGTELDLNPNLAVQWGGPRGLDRRKVRVEGNPVAGGRLRVRSIEPVAGPAGAAAAAVQTGPHPYVTILCKFSDIADEPQTVATYTAWTTGTSYPGLDHYWRQVSYNRMNVSGSKVVGWYTLPHPESYYVAPSTRDNPGYFHALDLVNDCVGAADADVYFPQFYGFNLQFNGWMSGGSVGGSSTLTLDGQTKTYGDALLYSGAAIADYAHEGGHALGLPHSSGPYSRTYDSKWDVMSWAGPGFYHDNWEHIPQHTISYHKDLLGWIPAARKLTVGPNTSRTITLERLALPGSGNYLMAQIPMDNAPGQFYTVEARQRVSYDDSLPGDAVVLHQVDPNRDRRVRDMGMTWLKWWTSTTMATRTTPVPCGRLARPLPMRPTGSRSPSTRRPPPASRSRSSAARPALG